MRTVWRAEDGRWTWKRLRGPIGVLRTINRVLRDRDWTPVLRFARRERRVVSAQQFIDGGKEGNMAVVCWRGEVLQCICLEVVRTWQAGGPSSVVRVIDQPEMVEAARRIVRRLEFSGFCGFDFIFEPATGRPLLLEMNARPTQVAHLALGAGRDLTSALRCALLGVPLQERPAVTDNDLIALFPHEWQRDPRSPMLRDGYHDVPKDQPELLRRGLTMRANRNAPGLLDMMHRWWAFYTGADLK
jgi:hypothetical protein